MNDGSNLKHSYLDQVVVEKLPRPNELHSVNIDGGGELASLAGVVAQLQALVGALQPPSAKNGKS